MAPAPPNPHSATCLPYLLPADVPHVDALLEEYTFTTFDASYTTQVLVAFEGSDQERDVVADGGAEIDWWVDVHGGGTTA